MLAIQNEKNPKKNNNTVSKYVYDPNTWHIHWNSIQMDLEGIIGKKPT